MRYQNAIAIENTHRYKLKMKKNTLLSLVVITTLSKLSLGSVFTYKLEGYPKEISSCYAQTKMIGEKFQTATKTNVIHTECTKETETGFDFVIEYEAATKLDFTSTDYRFGGVYQKGRYEKIEDCQTNLPKQAEIFRTATGLEPMFSFCTNSGLSSVKPWEVIITAPGKSAMQPELGGFMVFTQPQKVTYSEIFNGLETALKRYDAVLADLVFSSKFPMGEASIHYFAKDHFSFSLEHVTKIPKIEQCVEQVEEAKSWFKDSQNPPFAIYCGGPEFGEFEVNVGVVERASFTHQNSVEKFKSFDECQQNRAEVISHYSGSSLHKTLGGLCSRDSEDHSFHVVIFKQAKS